MTIRSEVCVLWRQTLTSDPTFDLCLQVLGLSVAGCAVWILFDRGTLLTFVSSGNGCR